MRKTKKLNKNRQKTWDAVFVLYLVIAIVTGIGLLLVQSSAIRFTDMYEFNGKVRYSTTITTNTNLDYDKQGQPILHAQQAGSRYLLSVSSGTNNRTASVPVGTKILVKYPDGQFGDYRIRMHPRDGVLSVPEGRYHFPLHTMGMYEVTGEGTVTISVIER
jgi:hypothetical protein